MSDITKEKAQELIDRLRAASTLQEAIDAKVEISREAPRALMTAIKQADEIERLNELLVSATDRELVHMKEIDALKAHVERLREGYGIIVGHLEEWKNTPATLRAQTQRLVSNSIPEFLAETPAQSLAIHDAGIEKRVRDECAKLLCSPLNKTGILEALRQKAVDIRG